MLDDYKEFLELHTYNGEDVTSYYGRQPLSRYHTVKRALELFEEISGSVVVELGTIRSYVHGGLTGCNSDDIGYWTPDEPENWDWGAGCFSRVVADHYQGKPVEIHTVDLAATHIQRCRTITAEFSSMFEYHTASSTDFLENFGKKIDLLYVDTGDMTPIGPTASHQLSEVRIMVKADVLSQRGLVLIDDVRNTTPLKAGGDDSKLGKAKFSIPYLLSEGYRVVMDEYQVLMQRGK